MQQAADFLPEGRQCLVQYLFPILKAADRPLRGNRAQITTCIEAGLMHLKVDLWSIQEGCIDLLQ